MRVLSGYQLRSSVKLDTILLVEDPEGSAQEFNKNDQD